VINQFKSRRTSDDDDADPARYPSKKVAARYFG
jgi:hypothetical protein